MNERLSPHAALIYVMVVVSAADRRMSDSELKVIGSIVQTLPVFGGFNVERLVPVAEACGTLLAVESGLNIVLGRVRDALPADLREVAYALAVEVAAADGRMGEEEARLLDLIAKALGIEPLSATAIAYGARVRHRRP